MFSRKAKIPPKPPAGAFCPLIQKDCVEGACKFWIRVSGKLPQSAEIVDRFDCTFAWFPMLLIENSQRQNQTAAAVESARNEAVKSGDELVKAVNHLHRTMATAVEMTAQQLTDRSEGRPLLEGRRWRSNG